MGLHKHNTFKSTCSYCGVGCGIVVKKESDRKLSLEGDKDNPVNKGMLCSKGMNLHYTVMDRSDRLEYPEMRMSRNHPMQRVSWDDALNRAAAVFKSIISKYGPDAVAFYVSGQCLTEEYYLINKLIKGFIGSNNIDTNSRLCMSSAVVGYKLSLGEDSVPASYEDIELADCFFITGANPAWCHPILYRRLEAHKLANPDVKIIVADPRRTQSCDLADIHLQLNPGTDVVLNHAIGRCLIEKGFIDEEFIVNHSDGFDQYRELVMQRTVQEAAEICGVKAKDIIRTAEYIGKSKGFISFWAMGLNQSVIGVNKNLSLINLSLITGRIGKPGNGPFSLTGQPNAMGGREVGGLANLLPNHRNLENPEHRNYVEKFWGIKENTIAPKPGLTATEMFQALENDKLKAIWVICTNPLVSLPDARQVDRALAKARFVVVQDISRKSDTLKYADLVLPAAAWAEKEGTMTNSERRISYLHPVVSPPGEALPDSDIIIKFAHKMGFEKGFDYKNVSEVFREHCLLSRGTNTDISGLSYEILQKQGTVQWPYPSEDSGEGTQRLFTDHKFYTANNRAKIHAVPDSNESEKTDDYFPLVLTTGRIRDQWHTMTKTGKVQKLKQHIPDCFLEIHPDDAKAREIKEGDLIEIFNNRGNVRVNAKLTTDIKRGVVFLPMHWGKILNNDLSRANNLTNNLVDPRSKEPDFKFSAVQVVKYSKPKQKILIVGAGAGAYAFIKSYREINQGDDILVFSREQHPFYNRILLPEYINGTKNWQDLQKMDESEEEHFNISIRRGTDVVRIDRFNKTVTDSEGEVHDYDILILSTGSRATKPKDIPPGIEGIFTMRTRQDADKLLPYVVEGNHIVMVGGGLIGLELAGALREKNLEVTVVHRSSRLMERQLDYLGCQLLAEELRQIGVKLIFNDEVQTIFGKGTISGIKLKSGKTLECKALVYGIGTTPNMELARETGLDCRRGVLVDNYLKTSDPSIYAIGEIAEFNQQLFGITVAAEEQAGILASHLGGNLNVFYEGTLMMNILKVQGINICSVGITEMPDDPEYEEILFIDKVKRYYKKCIVHRDRLVGAILIGDKAEFMEFTTLIRNKTELSEKRLSLLRSSQRAEAMEGKLICSCNSVGEGNITKKIQSGCTVFNELCQSTGAGMGCGSCKPEVRKILESYTVKDQLTI